MTKLNDIIASIEESKAAAAHAAAVREAELVKMTELTMAEADHLALVGAKLMVLVAEVDDAIEGFAAAEEEDRDVSLEEMQSFYREMRDLKVRLGAALKPVDMIVPNDLAEYALSVMGDESADDADAEEGDCGCPICALVRAAA